MSCPGIQRSIERRRDQIYRVGQFIGSIGARPTRIALWIRLNELTDAMHLVPTLVICPPDDVGQSTSE